MSLQNFKILKRLGEGAYSSVYSVMRNDDGEQYALKKVKMGKLSDKEKENALNEVRILASIQHTNICSYHEAFMDESSQSLCIIMEYANNGDLFQKISRHQKEQTYLREEDIWRIFIQLVKGLRCLHDTDIFHRDLKSANVFLNKDGTAKLGDMNVSKVAKKGLLYTQTGTPYYASPEVWRDQPYDIKSDIWSLGCVLYEAITLRPPFRADDMAGLYRKVLRGVYSRIPEHFSSELGDVCKSLIQVQASVRPTCEQILAMPAVIRMGEQLFMDDFYDDIEESPGRNELLSTIRVPKNLLYLTDRLPKPSYEASPGRLHNRSTDDDETKRRTQEPPDQQRLPSIPRQTKNVRQGKQVTAAQRAAEEVAQSQALPNLDRQRPHQNAKNGASSKQRGLKKSVPPQPQAAMQQPAKSRSVDMDEGSVAQQPPQAVLAESPSQKSLDPQKVAELQQQQRQNNNVLKPGSKKVTSIIQSQGQSKDLDNNPLSIQGEGKQAARKIATKGSRASTQIQNSNVVSPTSKQQNNVRQESRESANEYEADEFEKEDLVQMAEPQKPTMRPPKNARNPSNNEQKIMEKATTNATSRNGDNNSLMREISGRNRNDRQAEIFAQGQSSNQMPQLKPVNRPKGMNRDGSKEALIVSAREQHQQNKESLNSIPSQQNLHSQRANNPIYKSHNNPPINHQQAMYEARGQHVQGGHHLPRKPRVNYPGNMAYINISNDGQRLVGPLGLKKAEQELIKRRYKYSYANQDSISRVASVYGNPHGGGSVGNRNSNNGENLHDGNTYQYQSSARSGGANGSGNNQAHHGPSPYLQYTRDIQNLYRRQKVNNSNDNALPKLPRIQNQREVGSHLNNKGLPPISGSHNLGPAQLSSRNIQNSQLYSGQAQGGPNSYRHLKNRQQRGVPGSQAHLAAAASHENSNQGYIQGSGPYSLDRHHANHDMHASLNAMQIQQQPMRERPQAVSLQKKAVLQKRLEPININNSAQQHPRGMPPTTDRERVGNKRITSPTGNALPKTTTAKAPVQMLSSDQQ